MARTETLFGKAVVILASDVVNRAATFVVYALVARYLGATEVGQLALALSLFYAFQVFAAAGVRTLITREVARDPRSLPRQLASGTLLVTLASAVAIAVLEGAVRALGYSRDTASVVLVLGLALLPQTLSVVCEAVFQGIGHVRYIAYAQLPVQAGRVVLAYLLLRHGYGVVHVAWLLLASHIAVATLEWCLMLRFLAPPSPTAVVIGVSALRRTVASARVMARSSRTFLGIEGLTAISTSLNIVLLSAVEGVRAVGLYSAAVQLMIPITLVYQSVVLSVFPMLCRRFADGADQASPVVSRMLFLLVALAIPTAVGLFFLADSALLVYGARDFVEAATALRVMAWALIPAALTSVLGQVFLADSRERVTLRIVASNLVVSVIAGVILIAAFGLIGAAVAAVLARAVNLWQHYRPVSRLIPSLSLRHIGWKPAVAGLCMAAFFAVAPAGHLVLTAACAGTLYLGVVLALTMTGGGPRRFRAALSDGG